MDDEWRRVGSVVGCISDTGRQGNDGQEIFLNKLVGSTPDLRRWLKLEFGADGEALPLHLCSGGAKECKWHPRGGGFTVHCDCWRVRHPDDIHEDWILILHPEERVRTHGPAAEKQRKSRGGEIPIVDDVADRRRAVKPPPLQPPAGVVPASGRGREAARGDAVMRRVRSLRDTVGTSERSQQEAHRPPRMHWGSRARGSGERRPEGVR